MKTGPKYKLCKRLGPGLFEKCQTRGFQRSEARPGRVRKGRIGTRSDFAVQQLEKQRARYTYGLSEKQFARAVAEATQTRGAAATELFKRMESRLDNVVYRLGLAKTRRAARQLVSHGHITINGKVLNIPSHAVASGSTVGVRAQSKDSGAFVHLSVEASSEEGERAVPSWLSFDKGSMEGTVRTEPTSDTSESDLNLNAVVEFYSR